MEYKLITAVSGFPSLYDTNSLMYRDLNMRSDAWRQVAEIVGVSESECRRKWKTLRDQHRRERQRERERRESGVGLFNYRPWRFSAVLSFLNPFIDARAAGANGWTLEPPSMRFGAVDTPDCGATTETRSDEDDTYGSAATDATSSSSAFSEFVQRKQAPPPEGDAVLLREAKVEPCELTAPPAVLRLDPQLHQSHCSPPPPQEVLDHTDEEEEEEEEEEFGLNPSLSRARGRGLLLEDFLKRAETQVKVDTRDDVTLFLLSLAPAMRRLNAEKQSLVRTRIQQLLHQAQFGVFS